MPLCQNIPVFAVVDATLSPNVICPVLDISRFLCGSVVPIPILPVGFILTLSIADVYVLVPYPVLNTIPEPFIAPAPVPPTTLAIVNILLFA